MAENAINNETYDVDSSVESNYAKGIKNADVEDKDKALESIGKLIDEGYFVMAGNSNAINEDSEVFDEVIDLRQ